MRLSTPKLNVRISSPRWAASWSNSDGTICRRKWLLPTKSAVYSSRCAVKWASFSPTCGTGGNGSARVMSPQPSTNDPAKIAATSTEWIAARIIAAPSPPPPTAARARG